MSKAAMQKPPENEKPVYHNELIHEVEETLKREELERFWREYRFFLIGAVAAAILLTAAVSGWQSYKYKVNTTQTAVLTTAMSAEEDNLAAALAEAAPKLSGGRRAMALLTEAGALQRAGKMQEALGVYRTAAADGSLPAVWRDLASLLAVRMQWAAEMALKPETARGLIDELGPIIKNADSPWRWHAGLQAAMIAAHGLGDYDMALSYLTSLSDTGADRNSVPPSLKERARALAHVYRIRADEKTAKDGQVKN